MVRIVALAMLFLMLMTACTAKTSEPTAAVSQAGSASESAPAGKPPEDVFVAQSDPFPEPIDYYSVSIDRLAKYRALPAKYSVSELERLLGELPEMNIETPQSGEKIYLRDDPSRAGFLTSGKVTKADIKALVNEMSHSNEGQILDEMLEKYNLDYEDLRENPETAYPLFGEMENRRCIITMREMEHDVISVTIEPQNYSRGRICHLVFKKEDGAYRFAAMNTPYVNERGDDRVLMQDDQLYFLCGCEAWWGTGVSSKLANILPMQEGAHEVLFYQLDGYDSVYGIFENLQLSIPKIEQSSDGGLHFIITGRFWYKNNYEDYFDLRYDGFSSVFSGTCTWHVYDDCDGKGFYTYSQDMKTSFSLARSEQHSQGLLQRISLMLSAEDEVTCLLAEDFLWEMNKTIDAWPYRTRFEINEMWEELGKRPYEPQKTNNQKFYIGNAEPIEAANGAISEEAMLSLAQSLNTQGINIAETIEGFGLTLPKGIELPKEQIFEADDAHYYSDPIKEVIRHEEGDALVLEIRLHELTSSSDFSSINLMFRRAGNKYDFITVIVRKGNEYDEFGTNGSPYISEFNGLYYLHYNNYLDVPVINDKITAENIWIPFARGGSNARFRYGGGCALDSEGRQVEYFLDFNELESNTQFGSFVKAKITYHLTKVGIMVELPIELHNDGDGKGFYSIDANSVNYFSDILSIPYVRDQIEKKLKLRSESSYRYDRANAIEFLQELSG